MSRNLSLLRWSASAFLMVAGAAGTVLAADAPAPAPAPGAAPAGPPTPGSSEAIATALKQAKATYAQQTAAAKAEFLKAIDTRINSASDSGDLKTVTALKAARTSAETNGSLPPDVKEASIVSAKIHYDAVTKQLNTTMSQAYQTAIRDYTKARQFENAQGVQAEYEAANLGATATAAPPKPAVEPVTPLGKLLPPMWEANGPYGAVQGGGIEPHKGTHLISKPAEFLSPTRDWTFDVWFIIKKKDEQAVVGIGDGHFEGSIACAIRAPADQHHGVNICNGDQWGKRIVDLKEPGEYVLRIEKTGPALTFSVCQEKDGKLDVLGTRSINDPRDYMPKLSERSAHLYFGGAIIFKQYRLNFKAPGAPPPPKPIIVEPPAPPKKKKK